MDAKEKLMTTFLIVYVIAFAVLIRVASKTDLTYNGE
jgi:hypothetical protein